MEPPQPVCRSRGCSAAVAVVVLVVIGVLMSSTTHAPATAHPQTICGQSTDAKWSGYYEFRWSSAYSAGDWTKPKTTEYGDTGWATIIHSTNPAVRIRSQSRIHLCSSNPCYHIAQKWAESKYGAVGPPMHLQEVPRQCALPASAEASGSQLPLPAAVPTTVAGSSTEASSHAAELAPVGSAQVVEPAIVVEPVVVIECPLQSKQ